MGGGRPILRASFTCLNGIGLGLVGTLLVSRLLSGFLFGVRASNPATYGMVAVTLVLVGLTATFLPALRIARMNPGEVLRPN